jgi:GT2 family glycosyltransferase
LDPANPLVVSIVVNYRGLDDTVRCVHSLLAATYDPHEVVVVDNGSTADEAAGLAAQFGDRIHVIASSINRGYGGAANLGLRWGLEQGASYCWVLNNDTVIEPTCIATMVHSMETNPGYGILSPQIEAPQGPEAPYGIWFAGGRVLLERAETRHSVTLAEGQDLVDAEYITGCAMFLRSASLSDTGLFWEELFLFWEDVDLSLSSRRAGWRLGVVPAARITHLIHGTIPSRSIEYYHFRNALLVVRKFASRRTTALALMFLAGGVGRRWARAVLRRRRAPTAAARGVLTGALMVAGLRKLSSEPRP